MYVLNTIVHKYACLYIVQCCKDGKVIYTVQNDYVYQHVAVNAFKCLPIMVQYIDHGLLYL